MTLIDPSSGLGAEVLREGRDHPVLDGLTQVIEMCGTRSDVYVRFGHAPDEGDATARRERESGYLLPGVPAWPLCPESWWGAGTRVWISRQLSRRAHLSRAGAEPWLVTGEVRGRGPDCEPLLAHVAPIALIHRKVLAEAEESYAEWQTRAFRAITG